MINQELDPGTGLFFRNNTGAAEARGVEFEVEGKLPQGWHAVASYTFADTEGSFGERLDNSPQHLGKLNLSLPLWLDKVFAGLELQATSSRKTVAGGKSDAYAIVNFTLFSRELARGLELSTSLYNLFDQSYTHPVSADFTYTGPISGNLIALDQIEQDGRTFRIKMTYSF